MDFPCMVMSYRYTVKAIVESHASIIEKSTYKKTLQSLHLGLLDHTI